MAASTTAWVSLDIACPGGGAPSSNLTIEDTSLPAASSGVLYDHDFTISGSTGRIVLIDITATDGSPNKDSPRWVGVLPALVKLKGTPA